MVKLKQINCNINTVENQVVNMNKHHNEVSNLLRHIKHISHQEAEELYGIQFHDDGTVYDIVNERNYNTIGEWAEENTFEDDFEQFEHHSKWED